MNKFKIIGLTIIISNLFWFWFSIDLLYKYHYTEFHPTFYIPNWILIMNLIFGIVGVLIGYKLLNRKLTIKTALLSDFTMIIIGLTIQQI